MLTHDKENKDNTFRYVRYKYLPATSDRVSKDAGAALNATSNEKQSPNAPLPVGAYDGGSWGGIQPNGKSGGFGL